MRIPTAFGACLLSMLASGAAGAQGRPGPAAPVAPALAAPSAHAPAFRPARHAGSVPKLRIGAPVAYFDDRGPERVVERIVEREPEPPADPFDFANLPVRTGIRPPPTPTPTIYRLGGNPHRPTIRVIDAGRSEPEGGVRGRFHDPRTGAAVIFVGYSQRRLAR